MELSQAVREAVTAGHLGHLVTINPDGSPQVSIVWVGLDGDEIVVAHLMSGQKVRNIARDPRVVLTLECEGANDAGMANHLTVRGTARVTPGGAPELLGELAKTYIGPKAKFPPFPNPPPGHVIHIAVDRVAESAPGPAEHTPTN